MINEALPNNQNIERAIFSLLLIFPERFIEVVDYLFPKDFYQTSHQEIWKAMTTLHKQGQELDIVSIKTELVKQNIDPKPAMEDLIKCYEEQTPMGGNLMSFAKEIKNKSMLRQIIGVTNRCANNSRLDDAESSLILGGLEKDIVEISDNLKEDRPNDTEGILNEINADIARGEESGWKGFDTGFKWLDEQTGGLIPTQCWIIGGYTGQGKTFFLLQILLNVLIRGAKVMLMSTEMDRKMNMMRLLGNLAGLGTIRILKGKLDDSERERMLEAQKKLSNFKKSLAIYDNVYTVEDIRLKAKKRKLKEGLDVLFVDFIQNLRGSENIYERMSNAAIELQHIAQELNIVVVIASQVTQTAAGWQNKEAIEYKGAGEIAAIADVALWIKKVEEDKSARQIILRKVRHGIPGHFMVRMSFPSGRIIDMEQAENNGDASVWIGEEGNVTGQL